MEWNFARSHPPTLNKRLPLPGGGREGDYILSVLSFFPFSFWCQFHFLGERPLQALMWYYCAFVLPPKGKIQFGCNDRGESSKKTGLSTSGHLNPVPLNWEQYTSTPVGWARNRGMAPGEGRWKKEQSSLISCSPRLSANRVEETPPASPEENFGRAALLCGGEKARKEDARMIIFRSPLRSDPFPHKI